MILRTNTRSAMKEISENSMKYSCQEFKMQSKLSRTQSLPPTQSSITRLRLWRSMKAKVLSKHRAEMLYKLRRMLRKTIGSMKFHNFSMAKKLRSNNTQIRPHHNPKFNLPLPSSSINYWTYRTRETSTLLGSKTIETWLMITSIQWANPELRPPWQVGSMWCQTC